MADTAALVVALSAQLTRFEKDMKDAVGIADKHTKEIETRFEKMNKNIADQFDKVAQGFAQQAGPIGSILSSIGPVGVAIAAGVGAAIIAFDKLGESVQRFVELNVRLREAADVTGLTVDQLHALSEAGEKVNVSVERTEYIIERLALAVQDLRTKGEGPLFDALARIDTSLLRQVAAAKNTKDAIDLIANAYRNLQTESERIQLAAAVGGGRRNIAPTARLLGEISGAGGVEQLDKSIKEAGRSIDEELNRRLIETQSEIKRLNREFDEIVGNMTSEAFLNAQKTWAQTWVDVARAASSMTILGALFARPQPPQAAPTTPTLRERFGPFIAAGQATQTLADLQAAQAQKDREAGLVLELQLLQRRTEVLGESLTLEEALRKKELELAAARIRTKEISAEDVARGIAAFIYAQKQAQEATRERLGVATEQQILDAKLAAIQFDLARGIITVTQATQAETVARKEAKEAAEALAVRVSYLPELTRFGIDASKGLKQFDQIATATFGNFENSIADVAVGSTKLADAFKKMTDSILRDLIRLTLRMTVTGPLATVLAGLFGGAPGVLAGAAPLGQGGIGHAQMGGPVRAGQPYVVGERGPELFVPTQAGKIVPAQPSMTSGGMGGTSIEINNYVAADTETKQQRQQGPDGERIVIDIVKRAQARGELDDVNRGRFALRPSKVR